MPPTVLYQRRSMNVVMSTESVEAYCASHPDVSALVVAQAAAGPSVHRFGQWD